MKPQLKAKLLRQIASKSNDRGFTLIELLVVIIIIGILSAISLPSFLNQANKAKQSEAKQYVGTLNRVQQVYFLENNQFASDMDSLSNPVPSQTVNYTYTFEVSALDAIQYGIPAGEALRAYAGMAAVSATAESGDAITTAVLCEANAPGASQPAKPTAPTAGTAERPACGEGTSAL